jgi:lipid II:glycine glycyltransferase (peptidoglycan interpeptide bridge formation enzyme)
MIFFELDAKTTTDWDNFILNSQYGSVHQISDWKKFQEQIPGRDLVLGFGVKDAESHEILATVICVKMETGKFNKFWFYSARGPVFDLKKHKKAGIFLVKEVAKSLQKLGGIFWRIDPYFNQNVINIFTDTSLKIKTAIQTYQPENTLEIDLTLTENEILRQMKRKGRYNIKQAQKNEVEIEILKNSEFLAQDLDDFYKLTNETTYRDGFFGHEKSYYENFLKNLPKYAVLFFATYKCVRIATAISTFCGDKAIYYFGASTSKPEYRKIMAPYLLQWEMMKYAKNNGCKTYDFLGIAPMSDNYKEGYDLQHDYAGITQFKTRFGGYRVNYGKSGEIILNKFWYKLYRELKKLKK